MTRTKHDAKVSAPAWLAAAWSATLAVPIYSGIRATQKLLLHEANPATVIWAAHSGFFWRCLTVAYVSGATFTLAYIAARRQPMRTARGLPMAVGIATVVLAVQATLAP